MMFPAVLLFQNGCSEICKDCTKVFLHRLRNSNTSIRQIVHFPITGFIKTLNSSKVEKCIELMTRSRGQSNVQQTFSLKKKLLTSVSAVFLCLSVFCCEGHKAFLILKICLEFSSCTVIWRFLLIYNLWLLIALANQAIFFLRLAHHDLRLPVDLTRTCTHSVLYLLFHWHASSL